MGKLKSINDFRDLWWNAPIRKTYEISKIYAEDWYLDSFEILGRADRIVRVAFYGQSPDRKRFVMVVSMSNLEIELWSSQLESIIQLDLECKVGIQGKKQ